MYKKGPDVETSGRKLKIKSMNYFYGYKSIIPSGSLVSKHSQ
jgi:hypothetical protein